jgi:ABC-type phosphate transport system substrate-binding protein
MTLRQFRWRGALPRAVLLAVVTSLVPLPLAAAGRDRTPGAGPITTSIKKIAVDGSTTPPPAVANTARRAQQTDSSRDSSFFKSKPGLAALAIMAAGVGYALYSTKNDRIKSPGKE